MTATQRLLSPHDSARLDSTRLDSTRHSTIEHHQNTAYMVNACMGGKAQKVQYGSVFPSTAVVLLAIATK